MARLPRGDGPADVSPEARRRRVVVGGLAVVCLALSLATLQGAFDAGDRRRALAALDTTPAGGAGGPSLAEALRQRNRGAPARCSAEVLSSTRGVTRVTCAVAGDPAPYLFLWDDLRRDALRPDGEATRRRLDGPTPPSPLR